MTEVEEYLETQRALDKNGKPDENVKAYKITNKLHSGTTDYY